MSHDDFAVIAYKILAYAYKCLKEGIEPSWDKAMDVAGCNPVYFAAVVSSLVQSGYIADAAPFKDARGDVIGWRGDLTLTLEGAEFLETNSKMAKVRGFLGRAFEASLKAAIEATMAIGGM